MSPLGVEHEGRLIRTDDEGYLLNLNDWSDALALKLASKLGLALTAHHCEHLALVRDFYQTYETTPTMRLYIKFAKQQGLEQLDSIQMMQLFTQSPMRTLCKLAGLPKPTNCL